MPSNSQSSENDTIAVNKKNLLSLLTAVTANDVTCYFQAGQENRNNEKPPYGTKWLTPRELVEDFVKKERLESLGIKL